MRDDTNYYLYKLINTLDNLTDLDEVFNMVKSRRKTLANENAAKLVKGEEVEITGSNKIEKGTVVKVNRTRAVIDVWDANKKFSVSYNVPFSMIRRINAKNN